MKQHCPEPRTVAPAGSPRRAPKLRLLGLMGLCALLTACATITTGTHQSLTVLTPGVDSTQCFVLQDKSAPLPVPANGTVTISRNSRPLTIECQKDGYYVAQTTLSPAIDAHALVQMATGYVVDYLSGAMYRFPDTVSLVMAAQAPAATAAQSGPAVAAADLR